MAAQGGGVGAKERGDRCCERRPDSSLKAPLAVNLNTDRQKC